MSIQPNTNHQSGSLLNKLRLLVADRAANAGASQEAYELIASSWDDDKYLDLIGQCSVFRTVEAKLLKVIKSIDTQLAQVDARARTIDWIYRRYGAVLGTTLHNDFVAWFAYITTDRMYITPEENIQLNVIITCYYSCLSANLAHYK